MSDGYGRTRDGVDGAGQSQWFMCGGIEDGGDRGGVCLGT